jgi:hypothetical protein
MKRFDLLAAGVLTAAVALGSDGALAEPRQRKPNIVVVMTDDVAGAISALMVAAPCAARPRRTSTVSLPKACAS